MALDVGIRIGADESVRLLLEITEGWISKGCTRHMTAKREQPIHPI